jgi:hypothetical protein
MLITGIIGTGIIVLSTEQVLGDVVELSYESVKDSVSDCTPDVLGIVCIKIYGSADFVSSIPCAKFLYVTSAIL